jgi:hypothetical protein
MLMLVVMQVTRVPAGVRPDDVFEVVLDLRLFSVICPLDAEGGDNIAIVAPDSRLKEGDEGAAGGGGGGGGAFDSSLLSLQKPFRVNTASSVTPVPNCAVAASMIVAAGTAPLDIESKDQLPRENRVGVGAGAAVSVVQSESSSDHMKGHAEVVSAIDLKESAAGASDTDTDRCSAAAPSSTKNAESVAAAAAAAVVRAAELWSCEKPEVLDVVDLSSALSPPSASLCSTQPDPGPNLSAVLQTGAIAPSAVPPSFDRLLPIPDPELCALKGDADADAYVTASKKRHSYAAGAGAGAMSAVAGRIAICQGDQQYPTSCTPKCHAQTGLSETEPPALKQQQQRLQRPHASLAEEGSSASVSVSYLIPYASHNANAHLKSTSEIKSTAAPELDQLARNRDGGANCGYDATQDSSQLIAVKWGNRKKGVDSTDRATRTASKKCPLCTYENSEQDVSTNASFCGVCMQDLRGAVHTPVAVKIPLATPCLTVISSTR